MVGYHYDKSNMMLGVRSEKTFGAKFSINESDEVVELFYRHYELNKKNLEKINSRSKLVKHLTPFFILHLGLGLLGIIKDSEYEHYLKNFLEFDYPHKLAIIENGRIPGIKHERAVYSNLSHKALEPLFEETFKRLGYYFKEDES
jgi:hypothetical protein